MKTENPFTKVDTVIVRVPDLDKARRWYEEKVGFQAAFTGKKERFIVFKAGSETSFTVYELKPGEKKATGKTPGSYPIFYTPDIVKAHRLLRGRGVKVGPVQGEQQDTKWFSFWDLDQNLLEVCHY